MPWRRIRHACRSRTISAGGRDPVGRMQEERVEVEVEDEEGDDVVGP